MFSQPVEGPRIVPYGQDREARDKLPNGRAGFRQTQRFTDVNPAFPHLGQHNAVDIGNFVCGDKLFSMGSGLARAFTDNAKAVGAPTDAIGVKIQHDPDRVTEIWHMDSTVIPFDRWVEVDDQQLIGVVGDTGLGSVCHAHIAYRYQGRLVDIWPHLRMNEEATVEVQGSWIQHIINRKTTLKYKTNFREGPFSGARVIHTFGIGKLFYPTVKVRGTSVSGNANWYGGWLSVDGKYRFGYFHASGLNSLVRLESISGGLTTEQVNSKIALAVKEALTQVEASVVTAVKTAISKFVPR